MIIKSPLIQNSIGQSIVFASRPKSSIVPIPFGLGVEMDHVFGSKWLINELSRLGFSVSYDEVTRYTVVQNENTVETFNRYAPGTFAQWVADNVDHNVAALDGTGTFHGMGIISVSTANGTFFANHHQLPPIKRQKLLRVKDVIRNKGVPILPFIRSD